MGRLQASEMARIVSIDLSLEWHLQSNHYPPVDKSFVSSAKEAIQFGKTEQWDRLIELPNGKLLTTAGVIDGLHLWEWLDAEH